MEYLKRIVPEVEVDENTDFKSWKEVLKDNSKLNISLI